MPGPMEEATRTRLIAVVVILAVAVPLGLVAAAGSGDDEDEGPNPIRVELSTELPEVLIYIDDESVNTPDRTNGRRSVTVECVDADGLVIASQDDAWPMVQTDAGTLAPHAHIPVNPARIRDVAKCRLKGTKPLLQADVS